MTQDVQSPTTPAPWADCRACDGTGLVRLPIHNAITGEDNTAIACKCPKRPKLFTCTCCECGETFQAKRYWAQFCTPAHKAAFHNRSAKRGKVMMPPMLAWRGSKAKKGDDTGRSARAEMCRLADKFNAEDRAAGRKPMYEFYARQLRTFARDH